MAELVEIELEKPEFDALADLVTGGTNDVLTVAATLGITRTDISNALLRSVSGRRHSFSYGPILERIGLSAAEFVGLASVHQQDVVPRLRSISPELFAAYDSFRNRIVSIGARAIANSRTTRGFEANVRPSMRTDPLVARRYVLIDRLGKGGQATVHKALDLALRRMVALKLYPPSTAMTESAENSSSVSVVEDLPATVLPEFRSSVGADQHTFREVRLLCGPARQPGILPLLDWGYDGSEPFLVFPLCVGDLSHKNRGSEPINPRQAATWVLEAAEALENLHAAGVVHADIKPHNLLRDEFGRVRVADLGLARSSSDPEFDYIAGSLSYMSPEQLCVQPIDQRTDIYGLGATLFEFLSGQPPYLVYRAGSDDIEMLRRRVLFEVPPTLPPGVPKRLKAICAKAMARDSADRFQTASELSEALRRWLNGGWRDAFARAAKWLRGGPRGDSDAESPRPPNFDIEEHTRRAFVETPADRMRLRMLASAEAGNWPQALQDLEMAWEAHREQADQIAMAQFLWDACRVSAFAGRRDSSIRFGQMAIDMYRYLHSPTEVFVSQFLAESSGEG